MKVPCILIATVIVITINTVAAKPTAVNPLHNIVKRRTCVPHGKVCSFNDYCCDNRRGAGFSLHYIPYACTIFQDFKCRSFLDIPQFGALIKLHFQLNNTNYMELYQKYWNAVLQNGY